MPNNRLTLKEFLLIAEAVLRISYDELERMVCVFRAESALAAPFVRVCGADLFIDPVEQAAICAQRLLRTRPLPLGSKSNRNVAFECMREMLLLSGYRWSRPEEGAEEVAKTLEAVEAGEIDLAEFVRWVRSRVTA
jgi:prophage maintenance system killer protein